MEHDTELFVALLRYEQCLQKLVFVFTVAEYRMK